MATKITIQTANIDASANAARLADLGRWPTWVNCEKSLLDRIPAEGQTDAPGFDAGLACALDLIPRDKQKLAATLHAAYTQEAVEQVRAEMADSSPDSESVWWLAACSVCREGGIDDEGFLRQIELFEGLVANPEARLDAAWSAFRSMGKSFDLVDGVPFVTQDGGMQGAYVAGYNWSVQWAANYGIFFIGTFLPSLGLEEFAWSDKKDASNRPMSGPVHGSKQFVKCSSIEELATAITVVRKHLGAPKAS